MQVRILGPLEVVDGDHPVSVGGPRVRALLARLALDAGKIVSVDALLDALWPDEAPGVNALQSVVSRLRRALPSPELVSSAATGYRLVLAPDSVDAYRFERLASQGHAALGEDRPAEAAAILREALELWRGPVLADLSDSPFRVPAAARLDEVRLSALEDRIAADLVLGRHATVAAEIDALARDHPFREHTRALQMRALYATGRQAEALAAYEETRGLLAESLGVDPSPALQALHLSMLHADESLLPEAAPSGSERLTNLRHQLTSFVGREVEVERIGKLLDEARLVTLVGPGGAGKTRLATEAAAQVAHRFPHGVWVVELAPVTDAADIAQTVLGSLGLRETRLLDTAMVATPRDIQARLSEALSERRLLLVLDNCEHLVDGVARLADHLLGFCPYLRILATSREPLGILGEMLCPVPSLGWPPLDATPVQALDYPAVQLFVDRATAVRPSFVLGGDTVASAIEICRRLDGLPLAIELAAARSRSLPIDEIAARLDDRFRLLTGGSRTAVPRHRTLRGVVEWSWDLLSPAEQALAERLSVFPAGATPESALAICSGEGVPSEEVLDLLGSLTDKSLLQPVDDAREPRFRMLETLREFGTERLAERGEIDAVRRAHARYFLELAERADPHLRGPDQLDWLARLTAERDNLLTALRFAGDSGDAATAVRFGAALAWYWTLLGSHAEAATWLEFVLDVPGESPPEAHAIALAAYGLSVVASNQDMSRLEEITPEVKRLATLIDPRSGSPLLALLEPAVAMIAGEDEQAIAAIDALLDHPDPWARALLLTFRGAISENLGEFGHLRRDQEAALEGFTAMGDRWGMAMTLATSAMVREGEGDLAGAIDAYEESIRLLGELRARDDVSQMRLRLGLARMRMGDLAGARVDLERADRVVAQSGSAESHAFLAWGWATFAIENNDFGGARRLCLEALDRYGPRIFGPPQVKAILLCTLALAEAELGDLDEAARRLDEGLDLAVESKDMPVIATVTVGRAHLEARRGRPREAAVLLGAARRLRGVDDALNPASRRVIQKITDELGTQAYEAAYDEGRALDRDAALALIRQ